MIFASLHERGALVHECPSLVSTLTLHPPFEKSGCRPVCVVQFFCKKNNSCIVIATILLQMTKIVDMLKKKDDQEVRNWHYKSD